MRIDICDNCVVHVLSRVELVGREREREAGRRFLAAVPQGAAGLVFRGEAGIGKTVLWRQIVDEACGLGYRVLVSRCFQAEMPLGFAALADLLEDVVDEVGDELPTAQRSALGFALRLSDPETGAPDALTVSRGVLGMLRLMAATTPVVLALDDVHWVDPASARVLSFALHRLEGEQVGTLLTHRRTEAEGERIALAATLAEGRLEELELGPLSLGALHHLVRTRLSTALPRATLVRLHEASGGNPMFALEFARALPASPSVGTLPIPGSLRDLVRERLAALPEKVRPLLELVAALGHPSLELLKRAHGGPVESQLETAVAAGVLLVEEDGRVRFSHPLLASAVYADAGPVRRRKLHRAAAAVATNEEERARHLALAQPDPTERLRPSSTARPSAPTGVARLTPRRNSRSGHSA